MIDKKQRNRCQYCRYQKCLNCGMKREAVQEERQRGGKSHKVRPIDDPRLELTDICSQGDDMSISSTQSLVNNGPGRDITVERLMEADQMSEARCGDKSIQYLRVAATNTMIPPEYRVSSTTQVIYNRF